MKNIIFIILILSMPVVFFGQALTATANGPIQSGFIYVLGITWTENKKQDSVLQIFIDKDTMKAVRQLLEYCIQESEANGVKNDILLWLNLDNIAKRINNENFNFYLKKYREVIKKNELKQRKGPTLFEIHR